LHRHLDGSLHLETILDLGRKYNVALPAWTPEELRPHVQVTEPQPGVMAFISKFKWLTEVLVNPDACRQVLRAMHCEIMLDAGAEDGMGAGFADERDGELTVPDRLLAVQARWMARNGEYEAAWKLFQEIENRRTSGGQPGEECIPAAALGRYYQIDLDVYASLWMGLAAQDLYLWDSADRLIDQGRKEYAAEAIGAFQFASALIRRQKAARLCEAALSTRHCPAAMKNVGQDFEHALAQVSQLSGAADIAQLRQKGKLVSRPALLKSSPSCPMRRR